MHLAIVESNRMGLEAFRAAKAQGHRVTFVHAAQAEWGVNDESRALLDAVDRRLEIASTTSAEEVLAALREVHREEPIDFAGTLEEFAAEPVALAARELGLRSTNPAAVIAARHKDACLEKVRGAGLAAPRSYLAADVEGAVRAAAEIGYPVIVKPQSGGDSLLARVATGVEEVGAAARRVLSGWDEVPTEWIGQFRRGILVEELLVGPLVSVEIGARDGEFFPFCVSGRMRWAEDQTVELGAFIPSRLEPAEADACVVYAEAVLAALGVDIGLFHVEVILTVGGPSLVEVNPRVMGGGLPLIYELVSGRSIYAAMVEIWTGAPVGVPDLSAAECVAGRKIAAAGSARLGPSLGFDWLVDYGDSLARFENYAMEPGRRVEPGEVFGRLMLRASDAGAAAALGDELIGRLEDELAVPLMAGDFDSTLAPTDRPTP